jgi:hypothetical protein
MINNYCAENEGEKCRTVDVSKLKKESVALFRHGLSGPEWSTPTCTPRGRTNSLSLQLVRSLSEQISSLSLPLPFILAASPSLPPSLPFFPLLSPLLSRMSSSADDFSVEYGSKVTGACVACKRAHHACDQERPQCARCIRLGCSCEYVLHRKPGRKRIQAIPPPEIEDVSAKKRRLLSDVARDGSHSSSSSSSSSSSAPLMSAASSATSAAHRAPRPPSTAPRPPQEQRHNPSILPFPKKISSATSHAPYGSFPQSDGGGDRFPMESAKVSPKFSNFESSSSSTETFLENLQSIRRPGQKSTESGGNRGVGDSNDMKRFPPHTHFPSPHHSGVSKNISEFHNLVLEGERELMSFNRMQKDEGKAFISPFAPK